MEEQENQKNLPKSVHWNIKLGGSFENLYGNKLLEGKAYDQLQTEGRTLLLIRGSLSINALRTCVYIYFRQLSSFRAPALWLTVATCHIQYTFLTLLVMARWGPNKGRGLKPSG